MKVVPAPLRPGDRVRILSVPERHVPAELTGRLGTVVILGTLTAYVRADRRADDPKDWDTVDHRTWWYGTDRLDQGGRRRPGRRPRK